MILAIETSFPEASMTLAREGEIIFSESFMNGRHHNSQVFDVLERVTELIEVGELTAIIVGTGPGSYSGTRVGIAVAQGLAVVHACPAIGLGSLAATSVARQAETSMAVGDARRGLYYVAEIQSQGEASEAELMDGEAFQKRVSCALDSEKSLFTMDDPEILGLNDVVKGRIIKGKPESDLLIDVWLGLSPERRETLMQKPLEPSYLRPPFTSKAKKGHPLLRQ